MASRNDKVPRELFEKGNELSQVIGIPRTKAYGIFSEGISLPNDVKIRKVPMSKEYEITAIWKRTWRMKL